MRISKNFGGSILGLLIGAISYTSCDIVEPPYGTQFEVPDTVQFPPPQFTPNTAAVKNILLEDYTGHRCGNCPEAGLVLKSLVEANNGRVIGLAVHVSEVFGAPKLPDYPEDFRTPTGDAFDATFGISSAGQPNGMVNRKLFSGNRVVNPSQWSSQTAALLSTSATPIDIQIANYSDTLQNRIVSYVYTAFLAAVPGNIKLGLYVVQDSIIAPQKWYGMGFPNDHDTDYVHMHMLRGNINGIWGETIASGGAVQGQSSRRDYSFSLQPGWVPKNCKVLAIVYDADTYEVIQVVEKGFLH